MKKIALIATTALLVFVTGTTTAKIYKWVDDEGKLHYTERPAPAGKKTEDIEDRIRFAASLPSKPGSSSYMPADSNEKAKEELSMEDEQVKNKKANQEYLKKLREYCETQQRNLATLKTDSPIAWEEDGQTELLSDQQRAEKIREIKESINKNCSSNAGKKEE